MPLSYINKRKIASVTYQVHNSTLPKQLSNLLKVQKNENNYNRRKTDFIHVKYKSERGRIAQDVIGKLTSTLGLSQTVCLIKNLFMYVCIYVCNSQISKDTGT